VALKKFIMKNEKDGFPVTAIREIRLLKELDHKNIIKLKEIVTGKPVENEEVGSVYLVFEFMDHDMAGLLDSGIYMQEEHVKCYFKQLLEGLHYLHSNNILHRDIKTSNLLINNKGILKLADFGLARPISETDPGKYTNKVITLWYRPPELLLGTEEYGAEVDMWSAGCILGELLSQDKRAILQGNTEADQLDRIFKLIGTPTEEIWPDAKQLPWYKSYTPTKQYKSRLREKYKNSGEPTIELLENLLCIDPKKRYTTSDALESKYLKTDPRPCDPSQIPSYPRSYHESTGKNRKQSMEQPYNKNKRNKTTHNEESYRSENNYSQNRGNNHNSYNQNQRKPSSRAHDTTTQRDGRTNRASLENISSQSNNNNPATQRNVSNNPTRGQTTNTTQNQPVNTFSQTSKSRTQNSNAGSGFPRTSVNNNSNGINNRGNRQQGQTSSNSATNSRTRKFSQSQLPNAEQ